MGLLSRLNLIWKAAFDRSRYLESSLRVFEGSGTFGAKPWPFNYRAAVEQCHSWVYRCAMGNAQQAASIPLRLYIRKRSRRELKLLGYAHGRCAFQTRAVSKAHRQYLAGELPHKPSRLLRAKLAEFGGDFEEVVAHPVLDVLRTANPNFNSFDLSVYRFLMLELTGNAYMHPIMSAELNRPTELWPMPSHWVEAIPGAPGSGQLIEAYVYGQAYTDKQRFERDEVLRSAYISPMDLIYGMGKVEAAWSTLGLHHAERVMQKALFDNHARPDHLVAIEGSTPDQVERWSAKVNSLLRGVRNAGKFLAVNGKVTVTPLAFPPDKLGSTEPLIEEIAGVFGYPVTKLKANDPNRANAETGDAGWLKDTILTMLRQDEEALNQNGYLALFGDGALVDDAVLGYDNPVPQNQDFDLRASQTLVAAGLRTINEDRALRGDDPVEGGDVPRVNGVPIDVLGQTPASPLGGLGLFSSGAASAAATPAADREPGPAVPDDLQRALDAALGKMASALRAEQKAMLDRLSLEMRLATGKSLRQADESTDACVARLVPDLIEQGYAPGEAVAVAQRHCGGADTKGLSHDATGADAGDGDADHAKEVAAIGDGTDRAAQRVGGSDPAVDDEPAGGGEAGPGVPPAGAAEPDHPRGDGRSVAGAEAKAGGIVSGEDPKRPADAADGAAIAAISHRALMLGEAECRCGGHEHHHPKAKAVRGADPDTSSEEVGDAEDDRREGEPDAPAEALARELAAIFREQQSAVLASLGVRQGKAKPRTKVARQDIERALARLRQAEAEVARRIESMIRDMLATGAAAGLEKAGLIVAFDVTNPRVAEFIRHYAIRLAGDITQTSIARLRRTLGAGLDAGEAIPQLADRVQATFESFSRDRAEMIARTESARAFVRGEELGWRESGVVVGKQWLLAPAACEFCRAIAKAYESRTVKLGEPFFRQGEVLEGMEGGRMVLDYEDLHGAPLHPHCRCDLIPVTRKVEAE